LVSYSTGRRRVFMFFRGIAVRLLLIFWWSSNLENVSDCYPVSFAEGRQYPPYNKICHRVAKSLQAIFAGSSINKLRASFSTTSDKFEKLKLKNPETIESDRNYQRYALSIRTTCSHLNLVRKSLSIDSGW
jgi:hypothetical protein